MKKVILLLLSISMLGFYSCTKDDDDTTDDNNGGGNTPVELTNYISIDGTKSELTQNLLLEEGKYYMVDEATNDTTYLRKWRIWIATDSLEIGETDFGGIYTGLYTELLSPEAEAPTAGTYVANADGAGIIPSYTTAIAADGYDFDAAGTTANIEGGNDMAITVDGENTTIKLSGTADGKAIVIQYTGKLDLKTVKSNNGIKELK